MTDDADQTALMQVLAGFAGRRVLCVGDIMIDRFVVGDVKRISPEAPVPVVNIARESNALGGAGNVVRNVAGLGSTTTLVTIVGDDEAGALVDRLVRETRGVEAHLRLSDERETTVKTRYFSADGHQLLRADRETVRPLTDAEAADLYDAVLAHLSSCDVVVLSDYAKGVFRNGLGANIIAAARQAQKPVIVDPKGSDYRRYAGATVITPNRSELAEATGALVATEPELIAAAQDLRRTTEAGAILVTRSGEGMTLVADAVTHLRAENREVTDVTGAGDTVVAVLAVALAAGATLPVAARLANTAAGIVVGRRRTAIATTADIAAALVHSGFAGFGRKILDRDTAAAQAQAWREQGLRVGFTNGCFDLLHPGHVALLHQARSACDRLIVGLNSDASVRRLKGETRPVQTIAARTTVLASLAAVDLVVVFEEDTPQALIELLRPDVLIKGADYSRANVVGGDFVESYGGRVVLATLVETYSTTATIAALKRSEG